MERNDKWYTLTETSFIVMSTLLTKSEISKEFRVSERTIDNWVKKEILPAVKLGRTVRFNRSEIESIIKNKKQ